MGEKEIFKWILLKTLRGEKIYRIFFRVCQKSPPDPPIRRSVAGQKAGDPPPYPTTPTPPLSSTYPPPPCFLQPFYNLVPLLVATLLRIVSSALSLRFNGFDPRPAPFTFTTLFQSVLSG